MNQNSKFLEIEPHVEINYIDKGSGDPIIFIPGLTFNTDFFEAQISHFSTTNKN